MTILAFYNLKGGVGKTSTAVNVAWHAARWKQRTLIWDLDPQGAASFYLGAKSQKDYPIGPLLQGKPSLSRLIQPTRWNNLSIIPASLSLRTADVKLSELGNIKQRLKSLLAPLAREYDLIILDCPPTLSPVAESIFGCADHLFVPVIPTHLSVRAFEQVQAWIDNKAYGKLTVTPFFNMVDRHRALHSDMLVRRPKAMKKALKSWIPYSTHVEQMGDHQAPVGEFAPYTPSAQAFRAMWFEIAEQLKL